MIPVAKSPWRDKKGWTRTANESSLSIEHMDFGEGEELIEQQERGERQTEFWILWSS